MTAASGEIDYLNPDVPPELPWHEVPLVVADEDSVAAYGRLVDDPDDCDIQIVQWPAPGWRPVDPGTGDEGGTVEGIFHSGWCGQVLRAQNDAVSGDYVLGWSTNPGEASEAVDEAEPARVSKRVVDPQRDPHHGEDQGEGSPAA